MFGTRSQSGVQHDSVPFFFLPCRQSSDDVVLLSSSRGVEDQAASSHGGTSWEPRCCSCLCVQILRRDAFFSQQVHNTPSMYSMAAGSTQISCKAVQVRVCMTGRFYSHN